MITTDMLKQRVWMADDDEFDYIVKNSNEQCARCGHLSQLV